MNDVWNNQAFWAMLGTLFGGVVLTIINKLLARGKEKFDLGAALRNELRKDNSDYRKEIDELSRRLDSWIKKYYEMDEQHKKRISELELDMSKMQRLLAQNGLDYPPKNN